MSTNKQAPYENKSSIYKTAKLFTSASHLIIQVSRTQMHEIKIRYKSKTEKLENQTPNCLIKILTFHFEVATRKSLYKTSPNFFLAWVLECTRRQC